MLSFCEECGKRYSFPPEKVEPGSNEFRCRACGFLMLVNASPEQEVESEASGSDNTTTASDTNGSS